MRHNRFLGILCAVVGFQASRCHGQVQRWDAEPRTETAADTDEQGVPVWTITTAAEPQPPLHYRLWPARHQLVPGNAMVPVHRAMVMMLEKRAASAQPSAFTENYEEWMQGPLGELPKAAVAEYLQENRSVLKELYRMTNMRETDYDLRIDDLQGSEVVQFLLPEIQNSRELSRLLALDARLALAEGRFEDASRALTTGIRVADSVGAAGDLLIIKLVSIAITGTMLEQVEKASGLPGSPNLYWALATIPESTYDVRRAVEFESSIVSRVFPALTDLPPQSADPSAWRERLVSMIRGLHEFSPLPPEGDASASAKLLAGIAILGLTESSRQQLLAHRYDVEAVENMTPSEAVVLSTAVSVERIEDNFLKWMLLPDSMQEKRQRSEDFLQSQFRSGFPSDLATAMAGLMLPATQAAQAAQQRTAQMIARLATVEAIRDYAATHEQLPETLDDLSNLPAWPDPISGEPFDYVRSTPTEARLTSTPSYPGDDKANVILRLTLPNTP